MSYISFGATHPEQSLPLTPSPELAHHRLNFFIRQKPKTCSVKNEANYYVQESVHGHPRPETIQFSSVAQSCPSPCNPMNRSTPGLPVHHQLPEFTQTHVHRVGDATLPSHPLSSPSPPAPNPSQHQGLF